MARGKAISVKIATPKIIKALETRLATLEKDWVNQEANEAKYQKAYDKYRKALTDYAMANIKSATNIRTNHRVWANTLNIDFDVDTKSADFPAEPQREFEVLGQHQYREMKEEISNAIRMLKMTDEEFVNTSTYNAVARYL